MSKKFKPLLRLSDVRSGQLYIRLVINVLGQVLINVVRTTSKPTIKHSDLSQKKYLMVDCRSFTVKSKDTSASDNLYPPYYDSKNNFVSDMVGIYDGKRQTTFFMGLALDPCFYLYSKGLFKFSHKLLQKLKDLKDDPIKAYLFLNPGVSLTAVQLLQIHIGHESAKEENKKQIQKVYNENNAHKPSRYHY